MSTVAFEALSEPLHFAPRPLDHRTASLVLDRLQRAVIVTDARAVPLFANGPATAVLQRGDAVSLSAGRLTLSSRRADATLAKYLAATTPNEEGVPDALVLRVARSNGLPPYQLLATRLDGAERPMDGPSPRFLIFLFEPHASRAVSTRILIELHGLSRAEARLAARLFQCCSIKESARSLNISLGTAKTHLKHVFAKCEVRTQAELLQLLALGLRSEF